MSERFPIDRAWLAITIPVIVAATYLSTLRRDGEERIAKAASRVSAVKVTPAEREVAALAQELDALESERESLSTKMNGLVIGLSRPAARTELLGLLADAVAPSRRLALLRSDAPGSGESIPVFAPTLRRARSALEARGASAPVLWRMELEGAFPDLRSAVDRIMATEGAFVPLGLSLEHSGNRLRLALWMWL